MGKSKNRKPNEEYRLKRPKNTTVKRILALDPGTTNMGISLVGVDKDLNVEVLANAVMTHPIHELAVNYKTGFNLFMIEIDRWVQMFEPDAIVLERFMTRGGGSMGQTIECIGIMIGALSAKYDLPIKLLSAATWKNAYHRKFLGEDLKKTYKICCTAPHQLDATLIGCYAIGLALQADVHYTPESIVHMAEQTSLTKLVNRKPRV